MGTFQTGRASLLLTTGVVLIIGLVPADYAVQKDGGIVTCDSATVFSQMSVTSKPVKTLRKGDEVVIVLDLNGPGGRWCEVADKDGAEHLGFVREDCLERESSAPQWSESRSGAEPASAAGEARDPAVDEKTSEAEDKTDHGPPWTRYRMGNLGLFVDLPRAPTPIDLPLPPRAQDVINNVAAYIYEDGRMAIVILYASANEPVPPGVADLVTGLMVARFRKGGDVSDIHTSTESSGSGRTTFKAGFVQDGIPKAVDGFIDVRGNRMWIVVGAHGRDDTAARSRVRRAIESVRLTR
jgi:hypothetical protein